MYCGLFAHVTGARQEMIIKLISNLILYQIISCLTYLQKFLAVFIPFLIPCLDVLDRSSYFVPTILEVIENFQSFICCSDS